MNKYIYKITLIFLVSVTALSCSDFLDVEPKDKILESNTFQTESGIVNVHNELYIQLDKYSLYGGQLTMDAVEVLGQQYNISTNHSQAKMVTYSYAEPAPKSTMEGIWQAAYSTIFLSNQFIENTVKYKGVISEEKASLLKGEAMAIRAMLHFDLLRLFGPIYKVNSSLPAIPYYDSVATSTNPIISAKDVVTKVLADLDASLILLQNDPVLTTGKYAATSAYDGNPYYSSNRGLRMNYLAVKCLKARVLLYSGDKVGASTVANEVISFTKSTPFFPWTPFFAATDSANPDRIFSSENFFALSDNNLYLKQEALFDSNLGDNDIYAPLLSRINAVFESNDNDYRNLPSWRIPAVGGKTQKTFFKYADVTDKNKNFRLQIPMLKLSEMYLIAAETATTSAEGIAFLNTLRFNRGLPNLASNAVVATEVAKEYKKEFIGEGQLFFYYKRNNSTTIPKGNVASGNVAMTALQYVVPLPESELNFH